MAVDGAISYSTASNSERGSAIRGAAAGGVENQSAITFMPLANSTGGGSNIVGGSVVSNHPVNGVVEYQMGNHAYITLQQGHDGVDENSVVTDATPCHPQTNRQRNTTHDNRLNAIENQLASFATVVQSIQHQLNGSTIHSQIIQPEPTTNYNTGTDATVTSEQIHSQLTPEPIDLHPIQVISQGKKMVTAHVMLQVGDKVCWKYSGDLMRHVSILEVTKPGLLRCQPIYDVKCNNGQVYDVRHDDLFISKDAATSFDRHGLLSSHSILSVSSQLDMTAIGGNVSPDKMAQYQALDSSQFRLSTFQTSIDSLILADDSVVTLKRFHDSLSTSMTAASKTGILQLPNLTELGPSISLRDLMLPPPSYCNFSVARACYDNIARCIATLFGKKEFAENAPKAKRAIRGVTNGSKDGIDPLYALYQIRFSFLGASDFDVYTTINTLQVHEGMLLVDFIALAQDIQVQFQLSALQNTTEN